MGALQYQEIYFSNNLEQCTLLLHISFSKQDGMQ